jgi:hypothetical protein
MMEFLPHVVTFLLMLLLGTFAGLVIYDNLDL